MADQSRARYSRAVRYSTEKTQHVLYFLKPVALRISNMILRGMSGTSSGACLGHHLGYVRGMSGASSGACLGQHLGHIPTMDKIGQQSAVLHASVMPWFMFENLPRDGQQWTTIRGATCISDAVLILTMAGTPATERQGPSRLQSWSKGLCGSSPSPR